MVEGDEIEQGDIFENCSVFAPPENLTVSAQGEEQNAEFRWVQQDVIVLSQSCDLVKGREKLTDLLSCAVWNRSELTGDLASNDGMEKARKGQMPGFHVLAACSINGHSREVRVVDFRRVHSLPIGFMRKQAEGRQRLRLLPPYREHLSQAFARYFMRVGLPADIPSFTSSKKR
ncbi:MAG: hypothetical protein HY235_20400 [Acidobacteria bacterium]|nr:hypothetical protein [Acidobacteriota bacterium]